MIRPEAVAMQVQMWWTCTKKMTHWSIAKLAWYILEHIWQQGYFIKYQSHCSMGLQHGEWGRPVDFLT